MIAKTDMKLEIRYFEMEPSSHRNGIQSIHTEMLIDTEKQEP